MKIAPVCLLIGAALVAGPLCLAQPATGDREGGSADARQGANARRAELKQEGLAKLLRATGLKVAELETSTAARNPQEVRVRWESFAGAAPRAAADAAQAASIEAFAIVGRQSALGSLPRQRSIELSSDQVLVVAVDAQEQVKGWALVPDPRLIRAEAPTPSGELRGQMLVRPTAEFLVPLPDDPTIIELRFYQPRWTGEAFVLEPLGKVSLP